MRFLSIATLLLVLCAEARAETCVASTYGTGDGYGGRRTASGERMNPSAMTAAHRALPFGTVVQVCRPHFIGSDVVVSSHAFPRGRCISVRINDRGPFVRGRCIDLSTSAMRQLCGRAGTCKVTVSR